MKSTNYVHMPETSILTDISMKLTTSFFQFPRYQKYALINCSLKRELNDQNPKNWHNIPFLFSVLLNMGIDTSANYREHNRHTAHAWAPMPFPPNSHRFIFFKKIIQCQIKEPWTSISCHSSMLNKIKIGTCV